MAFDFSGRSHPPAILHTRDPLRITYSPQHLEMVKKLGLL